MRILLNLAAATWLGGRYYLHNLALALGRLPADARPELLVNAPDADFAALARTVEGVPDDVDVVFPNWGLDRSVRVPQMHWIPDLQHRALPGNFTRVDRIRRDLGYRRLARRAQAVVVSSEAVRLDVAAAYPSTRPKLRVVHFRTVVAPEVANADPAAVADRYRLPDAFLLLPNQFWAHKNHRTAFAAIADLPLPLVCTGEPTDHRRPGAVESLLAEVDDAGHGDRLRILGVVPRDDYLQLLRACSAVVQPSLFEGWSSIVEDARALGKPIALSDIAVHREQDPPLAAFFSPTEPASLAGAVESALACEPPPEERALAANAAHVEAYARTFLGLAAETAATTRR